MPDPGSREQPMTGTPIGAEDGHAEYLTPDEIIPEQEYMRVLAHARELEAENVRLRAALKSIADQGQYSAIEAARQSRHIARAALAGTEGAPTP